MKLIKIGRSSTNHIVVNDVTVSSQHAVITVFDTRKICIKDLNSTNGTYVNGKRIIEETVITASDVIKVGSSTLDWVKYLNKEKKRDSPAFNNDNTVVKQKKSIGRSSGNDIVLNYTDASSNHAQLVEKVNSEILIADNGSTNGTYVNGKKVGLQVLCPGDRVLIANKYPLEWQNIFKGNTVKSPGQYRTTAVSLAATLVLIVGVLCFLRPWKEKT